MSVSPATYTSTTSDNLDKHYLGSLVCPACNQTQSTLEIQDKLLQCEQCKTIYPLLVCGEKVIPWLFEQPGTTLLEWKARLNGFLHLNEQSQLQYKEALKDKRLSKTSQKRINKLLEAKRQQVSQIDELLKPLELDSNSEVFNNSISALQSKTPKNQGLDSYYNNIFRDWAWNNSENEQLIECIDEFLAASKPLGKVLTLGAGAGRLSYDIHQKYTPTNSVLLDINPLLLLSACQVMQGNSFKLNEFPIAPLNKDNFVKQQSCEAPKVATDNVFYLFGDGMNPPVKEKSFDTIITPWLIDIIPQNLRDYIPRLNACLPVGGTWINTGSLAFFHKHKSWCYSEEEVIELILKSGFEIISSHRKTIQYLQSPLSAHGRTEEVFSFHAKKVKDVAVPPKYEYLPNWIRNTSKTIPSQYDQEITSSKYLLQAQVFGAINGERSIEQIGELVAKQYNLGLDEAIHAVRQIMIDYYEVN